MTSTCVSLIHLFGVGLGADRSNVSSGLHGLAAADLLPKHQLAVHLEAFRRVCDGFRQTMLRHELNTSQAYVKFTSEGCSCLETVAWRSTYPLLCTLAYLSRWCGGCHFMLPCLVIIMLS